MKSLSLQFIIIFLSFVVFIDCKTKLDLGEKSKLPVISTLFNNRMLLLLKGTYATDNPLDWSELNNGTGDLYLDTQGEGLDPVMTLVNQPKAGNVPIFLDIGEVRISSKYLKGLNELTQIRDTVDSNKFWDYIAPNRQVFCTVTYSFDNNTCTESNGILKASDFFNGIGAQFPSNDPSSQTESWESALITGQPWLGRQYYYAAIYFRSLVTGYALDAGIPVTGRFDNRPIVNGLNIVPRNNYVAGTTSAAKSSIVPKMFPALYTQLPTQADMQIRDGFDPYILEVRINLKENLMLHSYLTSRSTTVTYVGVSDIFFDHKGEGDAGGNILTRARVIYPETASSLTITGGSNSLLHYYGIFRIQETEFINVLPLAATPAKQGAKIKYLNPGNYKAVCLGDLTKQDGYPDTVVRETTFNIPEYPFRQTYNIDLTCP
ncbi:LIC11270 family surface protein [Leptospira harrisiae]|uniref:Uncharacterized protein n=1 Tax=Leptospira harrisiae TaxID=2023189 RepID=A0A2N0AL62_9LEPT|nr:hypothetical protein [Leptospira harrisiae]PJZ85003.1 hypothetical protein CH364_01640 [Leptospira harrisiae]PKA08506.1 hypothetical protein CH366_01640 [Leptospira harrisiae]